MIAMGVDPGTHTISAAVLEGSWQRPILRGLLIIRPQDKKAEKRVRTVDLCLHAKMLGAWVDHFKVEEVVVEGQHFHEQDKDVDDILCITAVAGMCMTGCIPNPAADLSVRLPRVRWPRAGDWSKFSKKGEDNIRHNRIRDIYLPGQCSRAQLAKFVTGGMTTAREYGDTLDAIGMAYWALKGYPRAGI